MADELAAQLHAAVVAGNEEALAASLAAGADPEAAVAGSASHDRALHLAAKHRHTTCAAMLLAAGADPAAANRSGLTALHLAASPFIALPSPSVREPSPLVALLLAAGACPSARAPELGPGCTPCHVAAFAGHAGVLLQLLRVQPEAALVADRRGETPLQWALRRNQMEAAQCLLEEGSLQHPRELLALLNSKGPWAMPLYPAVVARQPLTAEDGALLPSPCPGLGALLPDVMQRSVAEAALLVRHLPGADRKRLRTAALCLSRWREVEGARQLPLPIQWCLLAVAGCDTG